MIRFALLAVLMLAAGSAPAQDAKDDKDKKKELAPFQGTWKVVQFGLDGDPAPAVGIDLKFVIEGNQVTVKAGKQDASVWTIKVEADKDSGTIRTLNLTLDQQYGIYKFDKDGKLTIYLKKLDDLTALVKKFEVKGARCYVLEKEK